MKYSVYNINRKTVLAMGILFFGFMPLVTMASEVFFETAKNSFKAGEKIPVILNFKSTESINTIAGTIKFNKDDFKILEIKDQVSIITLWVEKPTEKTPGEISFAGIIPGGISTSKAKLLEVDFLTKRNGYLDLGFSGGRSYLNDGQGTERNLSLSKESIIFDKKLAHEDVPISDDSDLPEDFNIFISNEHPQYKDLYVAIFEPTDKKSGIKSQEFTETRLFWSPNEKHWRPAKSPELLSDQYLTSDIYVKVTDKNNNERVVIKNRTNLFRPQEKPIILSILGAIILFGALFRLRGRKSKFW